jgi:ParB-like chromosome segregation protein Spo0J
MDSCTTAVSPLEVDDMRIQEWDIGMLRPYANNPRVNEGAVQAVASSIKRFGFRQPIVADRDGVIVAGHTRWEAAKQLGLKKVPVHVAKDLTPELARAYRIADNKTAELAQWDDEKLTTELELLRNAGDDLQVLAFTSRELNSLLGKPADGSSLQYSARFEVVIECDGERQQRDVYERMVKEGHRCRVLTY